MQLNNAKIMRKINKIIWFTGLSGSGKTTISNFLKKKLKSKNFKVFVVDGDKFRKKNDTKSKFTKSNIISNNLAIIEYIKKIKKNYDYILVSVISPLRVTRNKAKKIFETDYFEVSVKCKIKTLVKRDTKGLYKLAKENKIKNLIGFNSNIDYEKSFYKTIIINTDKLTLKQSVKRIFNEIVK